MLRLRLKNPVPERISHHRPFPFLRADFPVKPRVHRRTERRWQVLSLPQKDGSFVASVLEAPDIVVYQKSRKAAEQEASKRFLERSDPYAYRSHPLAKTRTVTVDMEFDEEANAFVTSVKELEGISTFGKTELEALNKTAEMIRGYIRSMESNRKQIGLPPRKLAAIKRLVGLG